MDVVNLVSWSGRRASIAPDGETVVTESFTHEPGDLITLPDDVAADRIAYALAEPVTPESRKRAAALRKEWAAA